MFMPIGDLMKEICLVNIDMSTEINIYRKNGVHFSICTSILLESKKPKYCYLGIK